MNNAIKVLSERFKNKKVVLLGAGVSNMPLAEFLSSFGAEIEVRDKKTREALGAAAESLESLGARLVLGDGYLDGIKADFVFRSPGFRPDMEELKAAVDAGAVLTSEMELFMEVRPAFTVGITGSDGKSTTTTLVSKILEEKFGGSGRSVYLGGNIGYPLLHRVGEMDEDSFVSVELSSFQLMTINTPADVAVITNVSPNHLNWHTGMDEYIAAKAKLLDGAGRAVLNFGNEITRELGRKCACPVTYFSKNTISPDDIEEKDRFICLDGRNIVRYDKKTDTRDVLMTLDDILLPGLHNAENYMAASAALWDIVEKEHVVRVAHEFGGVKHRLELIRVKDGVYYYNSSIDSSPTRTAAALSAIRDKPINLICGGYDKNIPFEPLAKAIFEAGNVKSVTVTGATAPKILAAIDGEKGKHSAKILVSHVPDFKDAVMRASENADGGDAVLLSPACASFDAFANFEERGDFFRKIVEEL